MSPRRLEAIVEQFYIMISEPAKYASLFYVYYYLVEVEGVRELKRKFVELRNEMEEAFYWYGIYSCSEQLSYSAEGILEIDEDAFIKGYRIEDCLKMVHGTISNRAMEHFNYVSKNLCMFDGRGEGLDFVMTNCVGAENAIKCFSNPDSFLEVAEMMFALNKENTKGMCWWTEDYGGEPWSKICRTLRRKSSVTPIIFIDACWGMHHNTGMWINYIFLERKNDEVAEREGADEILDELEKLLDNNFDGRLIKVFDIAVKHDKELEKYRRFF